MTPTSLILSNSVELTLREQARTNEGKIANGRVVALAFATLLDSAFHFAPRATVGLDEVSPANAMLAAAWTIAAAAFAHALRRGWYSEAVADAMPAVDGIIILTLHALITHTLGGTEITRLHPLIVVASVSTLLAMTGALRLSWRSSAISTFSGIVVFSASASFVAYTPVQIAFVCAMIGSAGLLGAWISGIVRRAVYSEAQKTILARFLPRDLVQSDPGDALRLIAQPKIADVTVLVSDIRGFTSLAERMSPAETLELLNIVQGAFAEAVRDHGGTVDKFLGDGMLAVFGAPEPLGDHANCAVRAVRAMLGRLNEINSARAASGLAPLGVGIGLQSGTVVSGCLGSGARLEFTVLGDTVNTASRLQAMTKETGEQVLIGAGTVALLESGPAGLVRLGELPVRGRDRPVEVHALRQ